MKYLHNYKAYDEYIAHQKIKTTDPIRRKKWTNEEWASKIEGFKKAFAPLESFFKPNMRALCIGARTGQEVLALRETGLDAIGIDIVPFKDLVIEGDMHSIPFESDTFDFVFSNVFDHSLYPEKKISEIERVLKVGGKCMLQLLINFDHDEYSENNIEVIEHDIFLLFKKSRLNYSKRIERNFAGMDWEIVFEKDEKLTRFDEKIGDISTIALPDDYKKIWDEINLPVQRLKGQRHKLEKDFLKECLTELQRRAYYLTLAAEFAGAKNIAEVGTGHGWQFYSFAKYASEVGGHVWSCDIKEQRSSFYAKKYDHNTTFCHGDSKKMAEKIKTMQQKIDLFYIDGAHDKGSVIKDILNLREHQSENPVWIFDDFDIRFGCFYDIQRICNSGKLRFKVYKVGNTASGLPNHQVIIFGKI